MVDGGSSGMRRVLEQQRQAAGVAGIPDLAARRADLDRLKAAIRARRMEFVRAAAADFGRRSANETLILDVGPAVRGIGHMRRHLRRWMRPERVWSGHEFIPGRARIIRQPKGVVGVLAPWNYPFGLSLLPLATALAAGNRVMLKPSEHAPASAALMADLLGGLFPPDQVAVIEGGAQTGAAFASLPFDHLFFTGSTEVGRKVMRAAAENLVPVTLELGGKSPVILDRGADFAKAARDIAFAKIANAGQTCIAPDYVLVHRDDQAAFTAALASELSRKAHPEQMTGIISAAHVERIRSLTEEARAGGAQINGPEGGAARVVMPAVVTGAQANMRVMQEEAFSPLLPVLPYETLEDAVAHVATHPHPLALYYYGPDGAGRAKVLAETRSGNVTINGVMTHFGIEALPFGGVGASGMGAYHGRAGFDAVSHARGIYIEPRFGLVALGRPGGRFATIFSRYTMR